MIYVTGDTHANIDIGKLSTKKFPQQKTLTKKDYVIVCGDFGLVWDASDREMKWQKWLGNKRFTTLWVDGNHENYDALKLIPVTKKFGGLVQKIAPSIYHLCRGCVFDIDGSKFFVMGGASSHDKEYRTEGISWWPEELPSMEEMERGIAALDACNWQVDYVLTHCAPRSIQTAIASWYENDSLTSYLERVRTDLQFKRWYFGHYHIDRQINEQFIALYDKIVPVF